MDVPNLRAITRLTIAKHPITIWSVEQVPRSLSVGLLQDRLTVRRLIRESRIEATVSFFGMPLRQYERNVRNLCLLVGLWPLGLRGDGTRGLGCK